MKGFASFLIFVVGACVGSAVTWHYTKKYYEDLANEEIESVKEKFSSKKKEKESEAPKKVDTTKSISDYAKELAKNDYVNYSTTAEEKKDDIVTEIPFVISPDEFGELEDEGYRKISLTYYADGVLADDDDEIVEDVEGWVGEESLTHFGEFEPDSVHVRNHRLKADYEILLSQKEYYIDVLNEKPYLRSFNE